MVAGIRTLKHSGNEQRDYLALILSKKYLTCHLITLLEVICYCWMVSLRQFLKTVIPPRYECRSLIKWNIGILSGKPLESPCKRLRGIIYERSRCPDELGIVGRIICWSEENRHGVVYLIVNRSFIVAWNACSNCCESRRNDKQYDHHGNEKGLNPLNIPFQGLTYAGGAKLPAVPYLMNLQEICEVKKKNRSQNSICRCRGNIKPCGRKAHVY
jgi:hypothetical protein